MRKTIDKSKYRKQTGGFKPVTPKMREGGFIRLREGIFEHAASGKMTPYDFVIYLTLHKWANWRTGICTTTAASLASNWGDWGSVAEKAQDSEEQGTKRKRRTIQNCLQRLRNRGYISYRDGDGKRGSYPILINKYEPSLGPLVGWSLAAAESTDLDNPVYRYVSPTPFWEAYGETYAAQHMGSCAENVRSTVQPVCAAMYGLCAVNGTSDRIVRVPFQDVLDMTSQVQEDSKKNQEGSISSRADDSLREGGGTNREELDWLNESKETTVFDIDEDEDDLNLD